VLVDVHRAWVARPRGTRLVVLSDFDGTLADFDVDPTLPRIRSDAHAALVVLSSASSVSLGLVSGRRVADLTSRAALPLEVYMAGLHGLEIARPGRTWRHPALEGADAVAAALANALSPVVAATPGARLEFKGEAVAVHTRGVALSARADLRARVDSIGRPWEIAGRMRRLTGHDVVEFLPATVWTKGDAVHWIARDIASQTGQVPWVIYFGDDCTDEDAFGASNLSVAVGHRPSTATFRLNGPAEVAAALGAIAAIAADGAP
jgi:trehalose 6-phosphate phosphatase